jgi:hypothetical protein
MARHVTADHPGEDMSPITISKPTRTAITIPDEFACVRHVEEVNGDIYVPRVDQPIEMVAFEAGQNSPEVEWMSHAAESMKFGDDDYISMPARPVTFAGYFSHAHEVSNIREKASVGVFPLLYEKASSISTQKHAMLVVKKATDFVNPGQTAVIVGDCPLYAQQKKCQWQFPEEVGEQKIVCILGFLHIEMAAYECAGKLLAASGWDRMFALSRIHTSGTALSLLGSKDIKRTRHAHQLTLVWMQVLKRGAYESFCEVLKVLWYPMKCGKLAKQNNLRLSGFGSWLRNPHHFVSIHSRAEIWELETDDQCSDRSVPLVLHVRSHQLRSLVTSISERYVNAAAHTPRCLCRIREWQICCAKGGSQILHDGS